MLDEEESEREYRREAVLENLLKRTKESLANELYNIFISRDIERDNRKDGIPYMGWFWRDCEFVTKDVSIGKDDDNNIGIMEDNKWDYPERRMTEVEVDKFMELLDRVLAVNHGFSDDIVFYCRKRMGELRQWVQELHM